ncbi:MAG: phospholipase D-like domain-containing protein [Bacillus subtilis]|nr:phospholipase D-like domain-containing protein [Bacillus subtilis]
MEHYRLLTNGTEAFPAICRAIDEAKKTIIVKMFVWRDDAIGNRVLKHLLDAANRGVVVSVIKDRFAEVLEKGEENKQSLFHKPHTLKSILASKLLDVAYPMNKSKGFEQHPNPLMDVFLEHDNVSILRELELKDHTKFYLIDDELLIFGGINIEDKEFTHDYLNRTYHDYMIAVHSREFARRFQERFYQSMPFDDSRDDFILNQDERKEIEPTILKMIASAASTNRRHHGVFRRRQRIEGASSERLRAALKSIFSPAPAPIFKPTTIASFYKSCICLTRKTS